MRAALATLKWGLMEDHASKVQRKDLGNNPREIFLEKRGKEYLRARPS